MPELSDELIAALLGGGIAGAIIAGLVTLTTQSRLFRREDRYRFNDVKRDKYLRLLVGADTWLQQVRTAHRAHLIVKMREEGGDDDVRRPPPVDIRDPDALLKLAQEVSLLGDDTVVAAAINMV